MNYHLASTHYILPYPHSTRDRAERHAANLGGGFTVVECEPLAVNEDNYEMAEEDRALELQLDTEANKYGVSDDER